MLPWGAYDSKVPKELFKDQSFGIKSDRSHAGGAQHAKEKVGRGGGAHREWCSVGETRRWGTVVGVCLVPERGTGHGL